MMTHLKIVLTTDASKPWTPIFAVDIQYATLNGTARYTQFTLTPAAASIIYSWQCTVCDKLYIHIHITDCLGLMK